MKVHKKIFLVDDDPDFIMLIKSMLEKNGYEVDTAYDGDECLRRVRDVNPDLIVLDVMMPHKHGYNVCKELKADKMFAQVPIIMLTAVEAHMATTTYTRRMGMELEADDFFDKPVQLPELLKRIQELLAN